MLSTLWQLFAHLFFSILHVMPSSSFPRPLSTAREKELLERCAKGDQEARQQLIEHNLRLVAHIVKKYYAVHSDPDDLISIGTIGLIKAVNTFNSDKGARLSSYASRCIENEILMVFRAGKKSAQDVSLNETIETDRSGNPLTLMDTLSDDSDIIDLMDSRLKTQQLYQYIHKVLSPRERIIITLRYGLGGDAPLPQREVAEKLGISRSYVSRIEKKALQNLQKCFLPQKH